MKLTDIHTHTQHSNADILSILNVSLPEAEQMIVADATGLFSCGIHPWDLEKVDAHWEEKLLKVCEDSRFVLIGECGLDKNVETPMDMQVTIFEKHIALSERLQKPLIIHCVGYFNELMELRKKHQPEQRWIIHGFRGKPQLAEQLLKSGIDLSFGEKWNAESVSVTPVERLFVETDESALSIEKIYKQIAEIKQCSPEDLNAGWKLAKKGQSVS